MTGRELDDWDLLESATAEDGRGFAELVRRHYRAALAFARQVLGDQHKAEDVTQKAFVNVFVARERFERKARFRTLLFRVVVNLALNEVARVRGARSFSELAEEESEFQVPAPPGELDRPEAAAEARELGQMIENGLMRLSPRHRAALYLREYQGLPYGEIATTLDASLAEVKIWIHRGRAALQQILRPYLDRGESVR